MRWWPAACRFGDLIRVQTGSVWHYGVYLSDDEVIQFGPPPRGELTPPGQIRVCSTNIEDFAGGDTVEVALLSPLEKLRRLSPKRTAEKARARLGEGGYDLLHNNCEHFAMDCVFGRPSSGQAEAALSVKGRPAEVWLSRIPETLPDQAVVPDERAREILETRDPVLKRQRRWDWEVLSRLVQSRFGTGLGSLGLEKNQHGKWVSSRLFVSLSHSGDWVAAAALEEPVGVDIELWPGGDRAGREALSARMLTRKERGRYASPELPETLALWTRKECLFKRMDGSSFEPGKIEAGDPTVRTFVLAGVGFVSVSTRSGRPVRLRLLDGGEARDADVREWSMP